MKLNLLNDMARTCRLLSLLLLLAVGLADLEKLLYAASKPNGKKVLTGKELGIPSLEKGKIELSNFSDKPFALTPTQLSQKYKEVELEELLEMLMDL